MTGWGRALVGMFAVAAIGPIIFSFLSDSWAHGIGYTSGLGAAYLNSVLLAASAATIAAGIAAYLLFVARRPREAAVFAAILFAAPGDFVASGITRCVKCLLGYPSEFWRGLILISVEAGYCFPFVIVAFFGCLFLLGGSRMYALHELSGSRRTLLRSLVHAYRVPVALAWLLGFNIVISETSRATILAGNAFGLGRRFFAPEIASGFATKGVDPTLFVFASLPLVPLGALALLVRTRIRALPQ